MRVGVLALPVGGVGVAVVADKRAGVVRVAAVQAGERVELSGVRRERRVASGALQADVVGSGERGVAAMAFVGSWCGTGWEDRRRRRHCSEQSYRSCWGWCCRWWCCVETLRCDTWAVIRAAVQKSLSSLVVFICLATAFVGGRVVFRRRAVWFSVLRLW